MSGLDSWEDEQDAQDDLSRRTQQNLNLNSSANVFRPGATTFQPGAQSFQPQQGQFHGNQGQQSYGGYQQYPHQGYYQGFNQNPGFPDQRQYGQHNGYDHNQQQYGGYSQQPGHRPTQQQQAYQLPQRQQQLHTQSQSQSQNQTQRTPVIAKRATGDTDASGATSMTTPRPEAKSLAPIVLSISADPSTPKVEQVGQAKVLSIGGDIASKVETAGSTKVLSISSTTPTPAPATVKDSVDPEEPAAGTKVAAARAIERTGEPATAASTGGTSPSSSGRNSPARAEQKGPGREADLVAKEQAADVDEETLKEMYGKEHVNVIFLGHVDAGKSTLGGSILYATGMVDERTMEKYRKEAKDAGRETWYLSWALDLTKEERSKGKTVEVGRGFFETDKRRYSILDAPGHKNYVPSMIGGASQADVGVLVISARKGEYETGFERGGQTREHAMLAKTQGVNKLVIAVNKMDDPTVEWSEVRYEECTKKLTAFLKGVGYNPKADLMFMPISAQTTVGIKDRVPKDLAPWYDGPSLLEYLDNMQTLERKLNAPLMMPISAKYKDMGTMIEGKIESGVIKKGVQYLMMPNKDMISISALYGETEDEIDAAVCGDQVRLRLRGIEEEDILPGFVLCSVKRPVHTVNSFEAQIVLLDLKSILSAGFNCVMHVHSATIEITFAQLLHKLEKGTGRKSKKPPGFAKNGMSIIARLDVIDAAASVCIERFEDYAQMGRFTLRDQGQTIAIGKVTKLLSGTQDTT